MQCKCIVLLHTVQAIAHPSFGLFSFISSHFALENSPASVHAILPYSKGFICSSGPGTICLFEKTEDKNVYKCVRPVSLSSDQDSGEDLVVDDSEIMSIAFSPSEESVVCSTESQQLYILTLSAADVDKVCIIITCTRIMRSESKNMRS